MSKIHPPGFLILSRINSPSIILIFRLFSIFFLYYVSIFILSIVNFLTNGSNFSLLNNENNISIATTVKLEPTNLIRGKKKLIAR